MSLKRYSKHSKLLVCRSKHKLKLKLEFYLRFRFITLETFPHNDKWFKSVQDFRKTLSRSINLRDTTYFCLLTFRCIRQYVSVWSFVLKRNGVTKELLFSSFNVQRRRISFSHVPVFMYYIHPSCFWQTVCCVANL